MGKGWRRGVFVLIRAGMEERRYHITGLWGAPGRCGQHPWILQVGVAVLEHKHLLSGASEVAQCLCLSPMPVFPVYHGYQNWCGKRTDLPKTFLLGPWFCVFLCQWWSQNILGVVFCNGSGHLLKRRNGGVWINLELLEAQSMLHLSVPWCT